MYAQLPGFRWHMLNPTGVSQQHAAWSVSRRGGCIPAGSRYHTLGTCDAMATPKMATRLLQTQKIYQLWGLDECAWADKVGIEYIGCLFAWLNRLLRRASAALRQTFLLNLPRRFRVCSKKLGSVKLYDRDPEQDGLIAFVGLDHFAPNRCKATQSAHLIMSFRWSSANASMVAEWLRMDTQTKYRPIFRATAPPSIAKVTADASRAGLLSAHQHLGETDARFL